MSLRSNPRPGISRRRPFPDTFYDDIEQDCSAAGSNGQFYTDGARQRGSNSARRDAHGALLLFRWRRIAVIGDGGNDVAMFERSGLSIAIGNAGPQVRRAADLVTESNSEDGFANAIERFILGGDRSTAQARAG